MAIPAIGGVRSSISKIFIHSKRGRSCIDHRRARLGHRWLSFDCVVIKIIQRGKSSGSAYTVG
jgi:hypothetical protein